MQEQPHQPQPADLLGRPLGSLRLSVTDRCNLRCSYCMPAESYAWLPREDLLSFEELRRLSGAFVALGADRIRLTGGEPLLRRDLPELVRLLRALPGLKDLALTTNGLLLADLARPLAEAGLSRLTVSLDTLQPARFLAISKRDEHAQVLRGIEAAAHAGFASLKLDTVIMRGTNDDEIPALLEFARSRGAEIRFIEYMDVGGATEWNAQRVVPAQEILAIVAASHGTVQSSGGQGRAPSTPYALADGQRFGVIASMSAPFCDACDRSRVTADGMWFHCLYATQGVDLRGPLRAGATDAELSAKIRSAWAQRADRGAMERLGLADRRAESGELHTEMHVRGG
ncbi:MAG: GTP 3',8-cyclase MoaA [Planctomycetes bacterium]|nr:GTP 3',8-cyclase MoaA [Planctomycetota bacterium]